MDLLPVENQRKIPAPETNHLVEVVEEVVVVEEDEAEVVVVIVGAEVVLVLLVVGIMQLFRLIIISLIMEYILYKDILTSPILLWITLVAYIHYILVIGSVKASVQDLNHYVQGEKELLNGILHHLLGTLYRVLLASN